MRALNEAWEVLKDASRRTEFDLATGGMAGSPAGGPASNGGATSARRDDPNLPFWTGANGPPPGRPYGSIVAFGIYAGWSLGEIARRDRGYLMWLRERVEGEPYVAEITRMLNPDAEEAPRPGRKQRR
jgi:curved DNA-binding protein CbpA